jgi:hypothetical protein
MALATQRRMLVPWLHRLPRLYDPNSPNQCRPRSFRALSDPLLTLRCTESTISIMAAFLNRIAPLWLFSAWLQPHGAHDTNKRHAPVVLRGFETCVRFGRRRCWMVWVRIHQNEQPGESHQASFGHHLVRRAVQCDSGGSRRDRLLCVASQALSEGSQQWWWELLKSDDMQVLPKIEGVLKLLQWGTRRRREAREAKN